MACNCMPNPLEIRDICHYSKGKSWCVGRPRLLVVAASRRHWRWTNEARTETVREPAAEDGCATEGSGAVPPRPPFKFDRSARPR